MTLFRFAAAVLLYGSLALPLSSYACETPASICSSNGPGRFSLVRNSEPASVLVDESANPAVRHVAESFAADLGRVSGKRPRVLFDAASVSSDAVMIGVLDQSPLLDGLIRSGKLSAADISGQWEAYRQVVIDRPFSNITRALVIIGSDRRGGDFLLFQRVVRGSDRGKAGGGWRRHQLSRVLERLPSGSGRRLCAPCEPCWNRCSGAELSRGSWPRRPIGSCHCGW